MTRSKPRGLKTDYSKLYDVLIGRPTLGERTPNSAESEGLGPQDEYVDPYDIYVSHLLRWYTSFVFSYSFTISPKSSHVLKNKSLRFQYELISNFIRMMLPKYSNKYFVVFELYADNENMHCHGFTQFRTLDNIKLFKREVRLYFNLQTDDSRKKAPLTHVKSIGYDPDAQKRWIGYLSKEMAYMTRERYTPIYRWDDMTVPPILQKSKPVKIKRFLPVQPAYPDPHWVLLNLQHFHGFTNALPLRFHHQNDDELESEEEEEEEEDFTDYTLYLNLKKKFEKNL